MFVKLLRAENVEPRGDDMRLKDISTEQLIEWVNKGKHGKIAQGNEHVSDDRTYFQYEGLEEEDESGVKSNVYTLDQLKRELDKRYTNRG